MSDLIWDQWGIEDYLKSCIRSVDGKEKIDFVLMQKRFFFSQKTYNFVVWNSLKWSLMHKATSQASQCIRGLLLQPGMAQGHWFSWWFGQWDCPVHHWPASINVFVFQYWKLVSVFQGACKTLQWSEQNIIKTDDLLG